MNKIKGIKYIAPYLDNSGYAKAARDYILALNEAGVPLTLQPISFEDSHPDLGSQGSIIKSLTNKDIDYNVVIMHCTPEFWEKHKESSKLSIGYTIWETTQLPREWPEFINKNADKVMVATDWNVDVFKFSGVTIPICCIPHCIGPAEDSTDNFNIGGLSDSTYVFGFVGQFNERKDVFSLLRAYWWAFQQDEDVALVLKTYRFNYSEQEKAAVRALIGKLKSETVFKKYPKVYLIPDMLTEDEMNSLYRRMDCFVSLDRAEGWGYGGFQAGKYGKSVIATGFGGVNQYLKEDNSYLIDYTLLPVHGMSFNPWMQAEQLFAQADVHHGSQLMRHVFNNQKEAKEKGLKLQAYIKENFSYVTVAKKIIEEIEKAL